MLCGSLATRELTLTSRMYPFYVRDNLNIHFDTFGDLYLRNIWQHTKSDETLTVKQPLFKSFSLRNLYQFWVQFPEKIHIKKPVFKSLGLRSLLNKYLPEPEKFSISHPVLKNLYLRSYLQKLFTFPLDETFKVNHPLITELHFKNVVSKYNEIEFGKLYVDTLIFQNLALRNVLQKHEQHEGLNISQPSFVSLSGSTKPHISAPVLDGDVNLGTVFTIPLEWVDNSITHTGYALYRDTSPISSITTLDPIQTFDRDTKEFIDEDIEEDTTYYYRVTPLTYLGKLFSNLLKIYVPLYLRAPRDVISRFVSRSEPVKIAANVLGLSKALRLDKTFNSLSGIQTITGDYLNKIFIQSALSKWNPMNYVMNSSGSVMMGYGLRKEAALYDSLSKQQVSHIEYSPDFTIRNHSYGVTLVQEPVITDTSFLGVSKSLVRSTFVTLGSIIEGTYSQYLSGSATRDVSGIGHREMMLYRPTAYLVNNGVLNALVGYYRDDSHISDVSYGATFTPSVGNSEGVYEPSYGTRKYKYSHTQLNGVVAEGEYKSSYSIKDIEVGYKHFQLGKAGGAHSSFTGTSKDTYYCILGSEVGNGYCVLTKHAVVENIQFISNSLSKIQKVRAFLTEDQETTIFSGYLPPSGMPMTYDTYQIGNYIIPVFKRNYEVPHDGIRFTLYEKVYKSKEVTSGYEPPEGTKIDFSLFVDKK